MTDLDFSSPIDHFVYRLRNNFDHLPFIYDKESDPLVSAICKNDQSKLKKLLSSETINERVPFIDLSFLSMAILEGHVDLAEMMIGMGASIRAIDEHGYTPMHYAVWKCKPSCFPLCNYTYQNVRQGHECNSADGQQRLLDVLLKALDNDPESLLGAIFFDGASANEKAKISAEPFTFGRGISPFFLACGINCDSVINRFLSVLECSPDRESSLPIEIFEDKYNVNVFHLMIVSSIKFRPSPSRVGIVEAMIDKLPHAQVLLRKLHCRPHFYPENISPLQIAISEADRRPNPATVDVVKTVLKHATVEDFDQNSRAVSNQIAFRNSKLVEVLLRAGFPMADDNLHLSTYPKRRPLEQIRIIELLLAFGYPLHKELGLYTDDELPIELTLTLDMERTRKLYVDVIPSQLLEALRVVRRSNVLLSLQRQCRNAIRMQLRPRADEAIVKLPLPERVKRFLLIVDEPLLLGDFELE